MEPSNKAEITTPFDITRLDVTAHAEEGLDVPIINPRDNSDTGVVVRVLGVFAPRFKELLRQARKREEMTRNNPVARAVALTDEADVAEVLSEVTLGWTNMLENGKQLVFSRAEAARVYLQYPLIRKQVFEAALDTANFVKG